MKELILGLETSCDETAAAVVRGGREVLSSIVHSQVKDHAPWGGVVPEIAGRGHLESVVPVVESALSEACAAPSALGAVAVTARPGLLGSLLVGVTAAKALAWSWNLPLVAVHHVEAHAFAALMNLPAWEFPYVTLIVSGGHTSLYRTDSPLRHERIGSTRDDAAGEALDKAAALLGLGYPGGPALEKAGAGGNPQAYPFKRPLLAPDSLDFSFSGLKTALLYTLKGPGGRRSDPSRMGPSETADLSASFEAAVADTLTAKGLRACEQTGIPRLLVGGGVARNLRFRRTLAHAATRQGIEAAFAPPEQCTDNAAMIAGLGWFLLRAGRTAGLDLEACAR